MHETAKTIILSSAHTKQLIDWLKLTRKKGEQSFINGKYKITVTPGFIEINGILIDDASIKDELKCRPHVPSKAEAKKIRQDKAHAAKNR